MKQLIKKIVNHGGIWMFPMGFEESWENHKWDPFYHIIFSQELAWPCGSSALWIHSICLEPLIRFGESEIHKKIVNDVANGDVFISLASSELKGGSDVAHIETTAVLTEDGENYIVNGTKYWITGGARSDWFVTIVKTDFTTKKNAHKSCSLLAIPRKEGVFTTKLKIQGGSLSDIASVTFSNVKVPRDHIIGPLGEGFKLLMYNFNWERYMMAVGMVGSCRVCIYESIAWARERKTFGKPLIEHQVIRHKIANMSRKTLACHALCEKIGYQLKSDRIGNRDPSISRNIALLKVQCSRVMQYCTVEASQIFGGRSYIRGGRGAKVERLYRRVRAEAISGGSEEILLDFAIRQAKL